MKPAATATFQALCTAAVSAVKTPEAGPAAQNAGAAFSSFKDDLRKAGEKFLPRQGGMAPSARPGAPSVPPVPPAPVQPAAPTSSRR